MEKELIFSAYLVDPFRKSNLFHLGKDKVKPSNVLLALQQNRVPLVYLNRTNPHLQAFFQWEGFRKAELEEKKTLETWLQEYRRINSAFNGKNIRHILANSYGNLPYLEDGLDIIVDKANLIEIHQILRQLGFVEISHAREPYKFPYVKYYSEKSRFLLNIFLTMASEAQFLDSRTIWKNSPKNVIDGIAFHTFCPETSILFHLAQSVYLHRCFTLPETILLLENLNKINGNWGSIKDVAEQHGWPDGFYSGVYTVAKIEEKIYGTESVIDANLLRTADQNCSGAWKKFVQKRTKRNFQLPLRLKENLCKSFYFKKYLADFPPPRKILGLAKYYLGKIGAALPRRSKPFVISFSGIEGSGKTSCAACLKNVLTSCGVNVHIYANRSGREKILRLITKRRRALVEERQKSYGQKEDPTPINARILQEQSFAKKLRAFFNFISLNFAYLFRIWLPLVRGKVVICDRYVYDSLVDIASLFDRSDFQKGIINKMLLGLWPKPDISFFCDVPIETARERVENLKSTFPEEFLMKRFGLYYLMSSSLNFISINCQSKTEEIQKAVIGKVLNTYFS